MRRLKILYYWIFSSKNNVSFSEMFKFFFKPKVKTIANQFIQRIEREGLFYRVNFKNIPNKLFWPVQFDINSIYQVTAETFDQDDWHYYQKKHTTVDKGEILLDIGVAEGLFPLAVIANCEKIIMIEPSKVFVNALNKTFQPFKNKIVIHNLAVGNMDGEINFSEDSLSGRIDQQNDSSEVKIEIKRIDSIISEDDRITYLKADIEGFEFEMLKGAKNTIKRNKPKIAITTYHKENDAKEIISLILDYVPEYNYCVKGIFEHGPKPVMIHFWI